MLKTITEMSTLKQGIGAFFIFFAVALALPVFGAPESTEAAFAAATFIFAILTGFFISRLSTRYSTVGKTTSDGDSLWFNIFGNSKVFDQATQDRVVDIIDRYYQVAYDYDLAKNYEVGTPMVIEAYELFAELEKRADLTDGQLNALDHMTSALSDIELARNEAQVSGMEHMTSGMWTVSIALLAIVVGCLYLLRDGSLIFNLAVAVFSAGGLVVLLLMRDLDDFKLGEFMLAEESGQQLFETIGKLRYYHYKYLQSTLVKVPKHVKEYRVGKHEVGGTPNIEIVQNKNYDPNFKH